MIKLGNTNLSKLYLGSDEITKAYLGTNVVYEKTPTSTSTYSVSAIKANGVFLKYVTNPTIKHDASSAFIASVDNIDAYFEHADLSNMPAGGSFTYNSKAYYYSRVDAFTRVSDTTLQQYYVYIVQDGKLVAKGLIKSDGVLYPITDTTAATPPKTPQTTIAFMIEHGEPPKDSTYTGCLLDEFDINIKENGGKLLQSNVLKSYNFTYSGGKYLYTSDGTQISDGFSTGMDDYDYFDLELPTDSESAFVIAKLDASYTFLDINCKTVVSHRPAKISVWKWENWGGTEKDHDYNANAVMISKQKFIIPIGAGSPLKIEL